MSLVRYATARPSWSVEVVLCPPELPQQVPVSPGRVSHPCPRPGPPVPTGPPLPAPKPGPGRPSLCLGFLSAEELMSGLSPGGVEAKEQDRRVLRSEPSAGDAVVSTFPETVPTPAPLRGKRPVGWWGAGVNLCPGAFDAVLGGWRWGREPISWNGGWVREPLPALVRGSQAPPFCPEPQNASDGPLALQAEAGASLGHFSHVLGREPHQPRRSCAPVGCPRGLSEPHLLCAMRPPRGPGVSLLLAFPSSGGAPILGWCPLAHLPSPPSRVTCLALADPPASLLQGLVPMLSPPGSSRRISHLKAPD